MPDTIIIEVLNAQELRIIETHKVRTQHDAAWQSDLQSNSRYKKANIVLLDVFYTQSKSFSRPVEDKKVLDKVIIADLENDLLHSPDHYYVNHTVIEGTRWVCWIDKQRLDAIRQRFDYCIRQISALVSAPLWLGLSQRSRLFAQKALNEQRVLFYQLPIIYGILGHETVVMNAAQANAWINGSADELPQTIVLNDTAKNTDSYQATIYDTAQLKKLPNLWHQPKPAVAAKPMIPVRSWTVLIIIAMVLACLNSYLLFRHAQQLANHLDRQQLTVLQSVFPNANSADPYARLNAEYQQRGKARTTAMLKKLNASFKKHHIAIDKLTVNAPAKIMQFPLAGHTDKAKNLFAALRQQGFHLSFVEQQVTLTW